MSDRQRVRRARRGHGRGRGRGRVLAVAGGAGGAALLATVLSGAATEATADPVVTVNSLGDPSSPSTTVSSTDETLADAITHLDAVTGGGTIEFKSGLTGTIDLKYALPEITKPITIEGPGASKLTINGGGETVGSSILTVDAGSGTRSEIAGLTLTGGFATNKGGAVYARSPLVVSDAVIAQNYGYLGGGIAATDSLTVLDSTIADNRAFGSGGLSIDSTDPSARLVVDACTISGNDSKYNSGLGINDSSTLIENSTIADNTAYSNSSILLYASSPTLILGSTITGNELTRDLPDPTYYGAGIEAGVGSGKPTLTIEDSIVAGNTDSSGKDPDIYIGKAGGSVLQAVAFSLIGDPSGSGIVQDKGHDDILGTAAKPVSADLGALGDNGGLTETLAPLAGSPVVGAGDATEFDTKSLADPFDVDQRGVARTALWVPTSHGDGTDMGAVNARSSQTVTGARGDRRAAVTVVAPGLAVAPKSSLVVGFVDSRDGSRRPRLSFESVTFSVSGSRRTRRYRRASDSVRLPLRGLSKGTHTLRARVAYRELSGGRRIVTQTLKATIRVG